MLRTQQCPSDVAVGIGVIVVSVIAWILSLVASTVVVALMHVLFGGASTQPSFSFTGRGFEAPPPAPTGPDTATILAYLIPFVVCFLGLASGFGILKGANWGFSLAVVLFLLLCFVGGGAAIGGAIVVVYCILRLCGKLGLTVIRGPARPSGDPAA